MGFLRGSLRMIPSSSALLPRLPLKTDGNRLFLLDDLTVGLSKNGVFTAYNTGAGDYNI